MRARLVKSILLIGFICLIFVACFNCNDETEISDDSSRSEQPKTYPPAVIARLDADYYIDYKNGTIPIGDLPIGARVVDPSWEWEYRLGVNYSDMFWGGESTPPGEVKPVTWIVVAKDHYDGLESHVTLLSEELVGRFPLDNSTDRDYENAGYGYNHWGESGTGNADHGLRPWLNSTGIHAGEGFYRAFSEDFKRAVLATTLPNKEWKNGNAYSTQDYVFIPSTTELGDSVHDYTYRIGNNYPYFEGAGNAKRVARLDGDTWWYWTRSAVSNYGFIVRLVSSAGEFYNYDFLFDSFAVRPALNLKSGILVSEIEENQMAKDEKNDVTLEDSNQTDLISNPDPPEFIYTEYAVVDVDVLRLRSGPSTDHQILERLTSGTQLKVLSYQNEWLKVETPNGDQGWVHGDYVINGIGPFPYNNSDYSVAIDHTIISLCMEYFEVVDLLGEPTDVIKDEWGQLTYVHPGLELSYFYFDGWGGCYFIGKNVLFSIDINDRQASGPSNIRVGDSFESVTSKFPDLGNPIKVWDYYYKHDEREKYFKIMYGSEDTLYSVGPTSGIIYYDKDRKPIRICLPDYPNAYFTIELEDEKVTQMHLDLQVM